jgi:hypothetical protein
MNAVLCDSCGLPATPEHIARRIRRLELATRFRPLHMGVLFLGEAPPTRLEDYFYFCEGGPGESPLEHAGLSRVLFESLLTGVGIEVKAGKSNESCLAEFQKRGFFRADLVECPVEEIAPEVGQGTAPANASELAHRYGPTLVKRIQFSYKPKHVVLLPTRARGLIPLLHQAGLGDRLLLYQGLPLHFPHPQDPVSQAQFRTGLAELLSRASGR